MAGPQLKDNPQQINLRLEPELDKDVSHLAKGNGVSKTEMSRMLIRQGLKALTADPTPRPAKLTRAEETVLVGVLSWLMEQIGGTLDRLPPRPAAQWAKVAGAEMVEWADRAMLRSSREV